MPSSHAFGNAVLDHTIGNATYTPGTLTIALCTAAINKTMTPATIPEATYNGYTRKGTTATDWESAGTGAPGEMRNSAELLWDNVATSSDSNITHVALIDETANIVTYYGDVTSPGGGLPISPGTQPRFAANTLKLAETS